MAVKKQGFPPVIDRNSRVLILGTMPGKKSLDCLEYYSNPRNQFWKIIGNLYGFDPGLPYKGRIKLLLQHQVALWDVLEYCEGEGSLDQNIESPEPNDFSHFFEDHPNLKLLAFNGQKAYKLFVDEVEAKQSLPKLKTLRQVVLLSTSPAAALSFDAKLKAWQAIIQ